MSGVSGAIGQWPGIVWEPAYPVSWHLLGFNHPTSGELLCPASLDWNDPTWVHLRGSMSSNTYSPAIWCCPSNFRVHEKLRRGVEEVTAADLPVFLWPKGAYDPENPYRGFLRGPLLVMVRPISLFELSRLMIFDCFDRLINTYLSLQALQNRPISQHVVEMLPCTTSNLLHTNHLHMSQQW